MLRNFIRPSTAIDDIMATREKEFDNESNCKGEDMRNPGPGFVPFQVNINVMERYL